ncbi:MAG: alkylmercury lyase family protein [Kiloniellales bacterium]
MHHSPGHVPSYEVRPGVAFPNWDAVSSRQAHDALLATLALYDPFRDRSGFAPEDDKVRQALLRHYLESGRAPGRDELRRATGLPEAIVKIVLADLRDRDLVVLDRDGVGIVGAYPFTDRTTEHRVVIEGREINAMCALDALGAGAMARRDSAILSQCRECRAPLRILTAAAGTTIGDVQPADPIVWIGRHYRGNCAASSLCMTMCFFCSEAHLEAWRVAQVHLDGFRLSLAEGLEVGRALFEPALSGTTQ